MEFRASLSTSKTDDTTEQEDKLDDNMDGTQRCRMFRSSIIES